MVAGPLSLEVVFEPAAQSWPGADDGLVCELDRVGVAGDQPCRDHQVDEPILRRVDDHLMPRHLSTDRLTAGSRHDQPEDEVTELRALGVVEPAVQRLGRLGDGAADAARRLVAGDGQGAALVAEPRLAKGVRHEWQRPRLPLDLADQEVGETWLEDEPVLPCGGLDRLAQGAGGHRAEQEQALFDQDGQAGNACEIARVVGPQGEYDAPASGLGDECVEEPLPLVLVLTERERILGLVDEHDRVRSLRRSGQGLHRVTAGRDHHDMAAPTS